MSCFHFYFPSWDYNNEISEHQPTQSGPSPHLSQHFQKVHHFKAAAYKPCSLSGSSQPTFSATFSESISLQSSSSQARLSHQPTFSATFSESKLLKPCSSRPPLNLWRRWIFKTTQWKLREEVNTNQSRSWKRRWEARNQKSVNCGG